MQRIDIARFNKEYHISPFLKLSEIGKKHSYFHRKTGRLKYITGVYFWGFTFNNQIPSKKDDFIIYYIGKSEKDITERIMQEITQLIIGGFGNIPNTAWLKKNIFSARLKEAIQKTSRRKNMPYNPDGLHMLKFFKDDNLIQEIVSWMVESAIFCWIPLHNNKIASIKLLEKELHHITMTNCFGTGKLKNIKKHLWKIGSPETKIFNQINWQYNPQLKDWLEEVNKRLLLEIKSSP